MNRFVRLLSLFVFGIHRFSTSLNALNTGFSVYYNPAYRQKIDLVQKTVKTNPRYTRGVWKILRAMTNKTIQNQRTSATTLSQMIQKSRKLCKMSSKIQFSKKVGSRRVSAIRSRVVLYFCFAACFQEIVFPCMDGNFRMPFRYIKTNTSTKKYVLKIMKIWASN